MYLHGFGTTVVMNDSTTKEAEKLLFNVITDEYQNTDMLAGIRLLDKSTSSRENFFRVEIWTKFNDNEVGLKNEMQKHLEEVYI